MVRVLIFLIAIIPVYLSGSELYAADWAILPVRVSGISQNQVTRGPHLGLEASKNGYELARLAYQFTSIFSSNNLLEPQYVEEYYRQMKLSPGMKITVQQLQALVQKMDCEQILISSITERGGRYYIQSLVYYSSSNQLTDMITTSGVDLWFTLSRHLSERFKGLTIPQAIRQQKISPVVLVLDASGANYREIEELKKLVASISHPMIAVCSVDGTGALSDTRFMNSNRLTPLISRLRARKGAKHLNGFHRALECANQKITKVKTRKARTLLLVGASPGTSNDDTRLYSEFTRLTRNSLSLVVGTSALDTVSRNYWQKMVRNFTSQSANYEDVLYTQRILLTGAQQWLLGKRGDILYESPSAEINLRQQGTHIPAHMADNFKYSNMVGIYESLTKNKVLKHSNVEIMMRNTIVPFMKTELSSRNENENTEVRILLEIERKPFWVSMPRQAVFNSNGTLKIIKGQSYYFLLHFLQYHRQQ